MTATDTVTHGGVRLRVRTWRGQPGVAEVVSLPAGAVVSRPLVAMALEHAQGRGFHTVVTPALPPAEWRPYVDNGFSVREELVLLGHDLLDLDRRGPHRHRRATRRHHERVLELDHAAFEPFWRLDVVALRDALAATPSVRFRITNDRDGYALTGRAGDRGYLQRLAVHPSAVGHGIGRTLVLDGLWWLRRWRAREVLVNTQTDNERALGLYERLGFRRRATGLAVLQWPIEPR